MRPRWPLNLATPLLLGVMIGCAQTRTVVKPPDLSQIKRDPWVTAAFFKAPPSRPAVPTNSGSKKKVSERWNSPRS